MGWAGDVVLSFADGTCLFGGHETDMRFYPEYFPNKCEWPIDPATGEKLPIAADEPLVKFMRHGKNTKHGFWERLRCLVKGIR
jgi:hypothetical protein